MDIKRRVTVEVDLGALLRNYRKIVAHVKTMKVLCVLKANAYGLGVASYAKALYAAGCREFGVAEPHEALELLSVLRRGGEPADVQILSSILPDEIDPMVRAGVILPVTDLPTAKRISDAAKRQKKVARVHFKLDTGMGRLGILAKDALDVIREVKKLPNLDCEGIFSHCPMAYDPKDPFTKRQIKLFKSIVLSCNNEGIGFKKVHMAASDAINNFPETAKAPFTMVRTGINLHGSFDPFGRKALKVEPVLTLKTRVAQVRELPAGTTLGYGRTWCLSTPAKVATISAGYADGLPLALTNRGFVFIGGHRCKIIGRISMDYTTVDVTDVPNVKPGDEVVCFGRCGRDSITPDDWAALKGTHAYDVICSLGSRVQRVFTTLLFCLFASVAFCAEPLPQTVPAWFNTVDRSSAQDAMCAFTSNVIRCEWAGPDARVAASMPANFSFQFAVAGDSDVTNRVQKILRGTANAISPALRVELEKHGLLNSTLQWIVRISNPKIKQKDQYLNPGFHPAIFSESDFNFEMMSNVASRLTARNVPFPVKVTVEYSADMAPLGKASPGEDYPGVMPEDTFVGMYGAAFVARAPERLRKIKLSAAIDPIFGRSARYVWKTTGWPRLVSWDNDGRERLENGYAYCIYDVMNARPRIDVMVFAIIDEMIYSPPTIISIYSPTVVKRMYANKRLQSIEYLVNQKATPYDISPIWTPCKWRDEISRDAAGRMLTFSRYLPGKLRPDVFSVNGELVLSLSASGYPVRTKAVEYFVDDETGMLSYRSVGAEKEYGYGKHPIRRSGE